MIANQYRPVILWELVALAIAVVAILKGRVEAASRLDGGCLPGAGRCLYRYSSAGALARCAARYVVTLKACITDTAAELLAEHSNRC